MTNDTSSRISMRKSCYSPLPSGARNCGPKMPEMLVDHLTRYFLGNGTRVEEFQKEHESFSRENAVVTASPVGDSSVLVIIRSTLFSFFILGFYSSSSFISILFCRINQRNLGLWSSIKQRRKCLRDSRTSETPAGFGRYEK